MNARNFILSAIGITAVAIILPKLLGAEQPQRQTYEYLTIRWAGKENTHIIRPGGEVEFVGALIRQAKKPDQADNRSFYLNVAMNGLTKEGWEFAGISSDDVVMKRVLTR